MQIARIGAGHSRLHPADVVGAKAANLARMAALGLPVPPAFVLPVPLGAALLAGDADAEHRLLAGLAEGISYLEDATGRRLGDRRRPLLVSVRSGAAQSMPGMLDTVLDLGCTLTAVRGLVRMTGNPRFAWDCRRRLLEGYAEVVLGLDPGPFAACLARRITREGVSSDRDLDSDAWQQVAADYQALVDARSERLPDDPMAQLVAAARAVYGSWLSPRAVSYRRIQKLEHLQGSAVTVQAMVFGNRGRNSGAGVAFSRDPSTGVRQPIIDVIFDAQGEDVVSGRRTPDTAETIAQSLPAVATELRAALAQLERAFADVQDVEFTIKDGKLWILQTRSAKRTPRAALRDRKSVV
jgi:pyruvate,orthophosphate dikinase